MNRRNADQERERKRRESRESVKTNHSNKEIAELVNKMMAKHKKENEKEFLKLRDELGEIK